MLVLFAFVLLPLLLAAGAAVDYAGASRRRVEIQTAVDAATLAAVGVASRYLDTTPGATPQAAIAKARDYANGLFAADAYGADARLTLDIAFRDNRFVATGRGTGTHPVAFMHLAGVQHVDIAATAEVGSARPTFREMTLLLDVSESMGLAVDEQAQRRLFTATKAASGGADGCTFGCHVVDGRWSKPTNVIAKENGVRLRIDAMRDAVRTLLKDARSGPSPASYRFAMYTTDRTLKRLTDYTNNYSALESLTSALDLSGPLAKTNGIWNNDSRQDDALATLAKDLPPGGNGSSQADAVRWLIFVSDGLVDRDLAGGRRTGTVDAGVCRTIKDRNIRLAVIYTTYDPIYIDPLNPSSPLDGGYQSLVKPHDIAKAMKDCASPDLYFEAKDGAAIDKAFKQIFEQSGKMALSR